MKGGSPGGVRVEVWSDVGPLQIERRLQKDRLEVTFVPPTAGIYTILLTALGRPIPGSPFTVKVDEARYAPPFISPLRKSSVPLKNSVGVIDFGDEEMLVREDGSLIPLKKPINIMDHLSTAIVKDKMEKLIAPLDIIKKTSINEHLPPVSKMNYDNKNHIDLQHKKQLQNPRSQEARLSGREKLTSFKLSNYVSRQESIESLKCSRNIQKLITQFETSTKEIEANHNKESAKLYNKDWTFSKKADSNLAPRIRPNKYDPIPPDINLTTPSDRSESSSCSSISDTKVDVKHKNAKLSRSNSLSAYLERIASLLTPDSGEGRLGNFSSSETNLDRQNYHALGGVKVHRSVSLQDKLRIRPVQDFEIRSYKNLLSGGGTTKNIFRLNSEQVNNSLNRSCNSPSNLNRDGEHDLDVFNSDDLLDSMEFKVSSTRTLDNEELWPDQEVSGPFNVVAASRRLKPETVNLCSTKRNSADREDKLDADTIHRPIASVRKIKPSICSPPSPSLSPVIEISDDRENQTVLKNNSFADDFDALALSRHRSSPYKSDDSRRDTGVSSPSVCSASSYKTTDIFKSSFDSSSSKEDELINDITEPNMSFDLSSSDSDNLSLEHDNGASPILQGDHFKVPTPCHRLPTTPSHAEPRPDTADRTSRILPLIESNLSIITHIHDNNTNLRREWSLANTDSAPTESPPFALRNEWPSEEVFKTTKITNSIPATSISGTNASLESSPQAEAAYPSFASLDLPEAKSKVDPNKFETAQLNNSKSKSTARSRSRSSLSLDEKKLIFCKFNKFCTNIGLKKNSRGSFTVNRNDGSIKKADSERSLKIKFNRRSSKKKQKDSDQKQSALRKTSHYHTYHVVKSSSDVNFVGRMKDYWNNINRGSAAEREKKEKPARVGSVTPKIVAKNRDRFERMGKAMEKFMNKAENIASPKQPPKTEKPHDESNTKHIKSKRELSESKDKMTIEPKSTSKYQDEVKPWKLSDFIDKTPKSPFAERRNRTMKAFASTGNLSYNPDKSESRFELKHRNSINSNMRLSCKDIAMAAEANKSITRTDSYKIGKFDKLLNKDALLASLRSFNTESAYLKTFHENGGKTASGFDAQYPHVPVKPKKEFKNRSTFSYKTPLKFFNHDK